MELRHLRYFIAVAEAGSLTVAAEQHLHTAQPSLSRQMRDLEQEIGVKLMLRSARGIELTAAGKVFLDHARLALVQIGAAGEAARQAARTGKASFTVGFLTGYEMEWLPVVMDILRDELPNTELVIRSQSSPDLAADLLRGSIDVAFLRPEKAASALTFRLLNREPLVVVLPRDHHLAARDVLSVHDVSGETLIGVPMSNAPVLREVTDAYAMQCGADLRPDHEALNLAMAISLVASTGGIALLPLFARNLLPPSVVWRPLSGTPPVIGFSIGYNEANTSPLLKYVVSRIEEIKSSDPAGHAP